MFNWDEDYETLVTTSTVVLRDIPADAPQATPWLTRVRDIARRAMMPALVALGLTAVAAGVQFVPSFNNGAALSSLTQWSSLVFGDGDVVMPDALHTYDQSQYDRFRHGIAGFSDADLLDYARTTQASLIGAGDVMGGFLMDALYLAEREIDRRGLPRPMASLAAVLHRS